MYLPPQDKGQPINRWKLWQGRLRGLLKGAAFSLCVAVYATALIGATIMFFTAVSGGGAMHMCDRYFAAFLSGLIVVVLCMPLCMPLGMMEPR